MTDYAATLAALYPAAQWSLIGNDYAGLSWLDDSPKPTKKKLDDAWPQVQYDQDRAVVEHERRARYQSETDGLYFEAMRGDGDLTAWKAATAQIRADLPYPEAP
jgi:hypothetical protein